MERARNLITDQILPLSLADLIALIEKYHLRLLVLHNHLFLLDEIGFFPDQEVSEFLANTMKTIQNNKPQTTTAGLNNILK
jgi:hypothetical protein